MNKTLIAAAGAVAVIAGVGAGAVAMSDMVEAEEIKCNVAEAEWQPMENLIQKLGNDGWKITEIEIDDGCYEVEGLDEQGREVEAYINPKTFEVLELEIES